MRRILSEETGAALVAAMLTMVVAAALGGVAVTTALNVNQQSRDNTGERQALEAAEAGLQVALYRWNMLLPSAGNCVGDAVAQPAANGACASSTYTLGNNQSYQYYTTPALATGATCVGSTVTSTASISNICITSIGKSGSVTARSEIRAAAFAATPVFPYAGITGLGGITDSQNASITGVEASNRVITGDNNSTITGSLVLGPGGSYSPQSSKAPSQPPTVSLSNPIVLAPITPGTSATTNSDSRITNYLNNPSSPTSPYDPSSGVSFNPTSRVFSMGNNASITLGGSIYNFCSFTTGNGDTITLAAGVRTVIYIDSPQDTGSGCTNASGGTGAFQEMNNVTWVNPTNDATALQIYVYGPDTGSNNVLFRNNGTFYGTLDAPTSDVEVANNGTFNGAIAGSTVTLDQNASFSWSPGAGNISGSTQGLYYRTAWAQCQTAVPANPMANCG